jgi:[acyl-carrier-protein] S-malonyltransferase
MSVEGKVAYVFPGQGAQWVGMGRGLYSSSPQAKAVFDEADSLLNFPISKLCFEGPEETLRQTINAQPAILVVSIAYLRSSPLLQEDRYKPPAFVAGHSLGEYTALEAAQVLSFADALYLARERGRLMQEAGEKVSGGMAAILGLEEDLLKDVCQQCGTQIANINCPGQIAISGSTEALAQAIELANAKGARHVIRLQVSGAFHSPLMQPAADGMSQAISRLDFRHPLKPIIANTTAQPITTAEAVKTELLNQLCHCVQWQRSIEHMIDAGVSTFIEVGPGQVLTGLIKRINKAVQTLNTEVRSGK